MTVKLIVMQFLILGAVFNTSSAHARPINDTHLADESNTSEWLAYGRTHSEQRHSPLKQINAKNVASLKVDWFMDLPNDAGLAATPLVVEGVMYFTGSRNIVRAVNAVSGEVIWEYNPNIEATAGERLKVAYLHGSRGVAYWNDKVYLATRDGQLIAVNAKSGQEIWRVMTVDPSKALYISGAPKVFKGKVLIGNGGTENGASRGYVTAYDAERPGVFSSFQAIRQMDLKTKPWRWLQKPGKVSGGSMAVAAMPGTGLPTILNLMRFISALVMALHGIRKSGVPVVVIISLALPDNARRNLGLQFQYGYRPC